MSGGTEDRTKIMPVAESEDTGFFLPPYDYAGNLETPSSPSVGVKKGGDIDDVMSGAKGVMYYTDVIGFGASSSGFTAGQKFHPLGINYFMKSGLTCDNGADMWTYFEGIPRGDMLGKKIQQVMEQMGMPPLKGLAPGMIEDMQEGLNPRPILQATFGSAYPKCVQVTLPVGDSLSQTSDSQTGEQWIKGDITYIGGNIPAQTRWIQAKNRRGDLVYINRDVYDKTPKTMNPNGTPKQAVETFENGQKTSLLLAVVFLCGAMILKSL